MTLASTALIGEAFVGEGANAAHTNVVLGRRGGPVEAAWATAPATPSAGHVPFVTVVRPSVPVQPPTNLLIIAAIWVDPGVDDLDEAFANQRAAAFRAVRAAVLGTPQIDVVLDAARSGAVNPFYTPGPDVLARTAPEPAISR